VKPARSMKQKLAVIRLDGVEGGPARKETVSIAEHSLFDETRDVRGCRTCRHEC
jgi:hypothetical protein